MKKSIILILAVVMGLIPTVMSGQSLKDILSGLGKTDSTSTTSTQSSGKLGDILGTIGKITGNDKVTVADLSGTWTYTGPAVSFQSDNLIKKAGSVAGATAIENKIEPYFDKAGLQNLRIEFGADSTFTMNVKQAKLTGTISSTGDGYSFEFAFKAAGKLKLGSMTGYVARESADKISLTFDATKLINLVDKIASISGNSSMKAASSLLSSYDGMTVGFKLAKSN